MSMVIGDLPQINKLIRQYQLRATKALGQNFIIDQNVTDRIVKCVGDLSDQMVVEIGPGVGTLTRSLLVMSKTPRILAIEKDVQFKPALAQLAECKEGEGGRLEVIYEDALKLKLLDYSLLLNSAQNIGVHKIAIIANLPYNIGTHLLLGWLDEIYKSMVLESGFPDGDDVEPNKIDKKPRITSITIMLQQEVVQRIAACPRSKAYGFFTVISQWLCEVEEMLTIQPVAFWPSPKVMSTVVHLVPRYGQDLGCTKKQITQICDRAFAARRKMLRSSLSALSNQYPALKERLVDFNKSRAEELSVKEFVDLAKTLA
jgi:16S rRNA (adenine1518-N6/adenine1519-N6)-dimethyltransferase